MFFLLENTNLVASIACFVFAALFFYNRNRNRDLKKQIEQMQKQHESTLQHTKEVLQQQIENLETCHAAQVSSMEREFEKRTVALEGEWRIRLEAQKRESAEALRAERVQILEEKASLMELSEKELLVEAVHVLQSSYGIRINNLENAAFRANTQLDTINGKLGFFASDLAQLVGRVNQKASTKFKFGVRLTDDIFRDIVASVAKKHEFKRISDFYIEDARINAVVTSVNGYSTWTFFVDFNDNGTVTGDYFCASTNDDSSLPTNFAEAVKKEIIYHLHTV